MRHAFADGDRRTGADFYSTVSIRDDRLTPQNNEVLLLIIMNVHGHTVSRVRDNLQDRIGAVHFF
jgi:hypothetical protein